MALFETKITDDYKAFIGECVQKGMTDKDILTALTTKYSLPADYVTVKTINKYTDRFRGIIKKKPKKTKKGHKKYTDDLPDPEILHVASVEEAEHYPNAEVVIEGSEEVDVQDMAKLLKAHLPKQPTTVRLVTKNWNRLPEDKNAWDLLELLQDNEVAAAIQKRIIMDYYGIDTVREIWKNDRTSKLPHKRIVETSVVDEAIENRIASISKKIKLKGLEETWDELKGQDKQDDPYKNLQRRLEFDQLLKKIETTDTNNAVTMWREMRAMMKEETGTNQQPDMLDQLLKYKQLMGSDEKANKFDAFMEKQYELLQEQIREVKDSNTKTKEDLIEKQLALIEIKYATQFQEMKDTHMTPEKWEEFQQRREDWAKAHGWIPKDATTLANTREAAIERRVSTITNTVEQMPDKMANSFDKLADRIINGITKAMETYTNVLEKREYAAERRQQIAHTLPATIAPPPLPTSPVTSPLQQLGKIEQNLDARLKWKELKDAHDQLMATPTS